MKQCDCEFSDCIFKIITMQHVIDESHTNSNSQTVNHLLPSLGVSGWGLHSCMEITMFNQKKITFETNYNDLPLSTTDKNFQGFNTEILDAIIRVMDNSLERTSQSQFMLFRISFPIRGNANQKDEIILPDAELPQGNEVFTYFLNQYIRQLKHVRFAPL